MAALAASDGDDKGKDHVQSAVVLCSELAAGAPVAEETVQSKGAVKRAEFDLAASGRVSLLNGGGGGAEALRDGVSDETKRALGVGETGGSNEGF